MRARVVVSRTRRRRTDGYPVRMARSDKVRATVERIRDHLARVGWRAVFRGFEFFDRFVGAGPRCAWALIGIGYPAGVDARVIVRETDDDGDAGWMRFVRQSWRRKRDDAIVREPWRSRRLEDFKRRRIC